MTAKKTPAVEAAPEVQQTPDEALQSAVATFVAAADAYAASDPSGTAHQVTVEGYRVRYMGQQFLSLTLA